MSLADVVAKIVGFLRAGYPQGVPASDYVPLLALLRRRLSDEEVVAVASELVGQGALPVDTTDIRGRDHRHHRRNALAGGHRTG